MLLSDFKLNCLIACFGTASGSWPCLCMTSRNGHCVKQEVLIEKIPTIAWLLLPLYIVCSDLFLKKYVVIHNILPVIQFVQCKACTVLDQANAWVTSLDPTWAICVCVRFLLSQVILQVFIFISILAFCHWLALQADSVAKWEVIYMTG